MTERSGLFRILRSVGCLVVGVLVGTAASLYHSVLFPWGLGVVLALIALGAAGVRTLYRERYPILWTSVGLVGALVVLAGVEGSGSVLILADIPGFVLLGGTTLVVAVASAWPRFSSRPTRYDRGAVSSERIPKP